MGVPLKVAFRGSISTASAITRRARGGDPCASNSVKPTSSICSMAGDGRSASPLRDGQPEEKAPRKPPLAKHLERVVARLIAACADGARGRAFVDKIGGIVEQLDGFAVDAHGSRGEARASIVETLRRLDDDLRSNCSCRGNAELSRGLAADADAELAPFKARMPPSELARARAAALDRLLRDSFGLPG